MSCNSLFKRCLLLAPLAAALAACSVGPDYVRPTPLPQDTPLPTAFKEVAGWKVAQPNDGKLDQRWWEVFHDPVLSALEEQVVVSNQNIAAAEAQFRQAKALVREARAGYFPTITAGPAVSHSFQGGTGLSATTDTGSTVTTNPRRGGTTSTSYSLPVDLSWEVDVWGRIRRTVEANKANAQASQADLAAAQLSAQAELAQDYFLLRNQDMQIKLLNDTVASFQKALDLTRNRYNGGIAAKSDVLQADTQLKTTKAQAIDLTVQRAQLEHAIALLIGKPASSFSLPVAPMGDLFPDIPAGLPSQLLERRPDIAAAERRMAAANAQIGVAKAAYYPDLRLSASAGFQSLLLGDWLTWPSRFWSVGAGLTETVFDGGLRGAQTEAARAAYDQTVAAYRQTVLTGFQEVEDNLSALRILEAEAKAQAEAVQASEETLAVAVNQYKAGIISYLNVITAQTTALSNQRTEVGIQARRLTSSVGLIKALGGGWESSSLAEDTATAKK
ncbi:efflux transporter outer membrane subunit [Geomonas sp.]|uniref:efflux transporter outer membrane subunit n=1 Tax=Geomonas sp. TaxID=2651584 RepID=UPI002B46077C|nr:efflux transporter outer membrane subunit [Geomonas sp.]HJV36995.1 efflux transporter outer membrane subunit [Geomonas sp.]